MLGWSIVWAVFGTLAFTRGLQAGLVLYWLGFITVKATSWHSDQLLKVYRELNQLNNKIIARQRETITLKNETIKVQNDHINYLHGHEDYQGDS
jgi:hypothetical protein